MRQSIEFLVFLSLLQACASTMTNETDPIWTRQSSRAVDNGYIVYVESVAASDANRARFLAEAQALMDIRNECTLIPKGARIEDHFEKGDHGARDVFVKVGVEFQECETAKRATSVDEVQKIANIPMTEEVKRLEDEQKSPTAEVLAENEPVAPLQPINSTNGVRYASTDSTHYFILREQIAEEKQFVILQPGYYSGGGSAATVSSQTSPGQSVTPSHGPQLPGAATPTPVQQPMDKEAFHQRMVEHTSSLEQYEQAHPEVRQAVKPWSQVRNSLVRNYNSLPATAQKRPHYQQPPKGAAAQTQKPALHRRRH